MKKKGLGRKLNEIEIEMKKSGVEEKMMATMMMHR
jgi:hypothetical protein